MYSRSRSLLVPMRCASASAAAAAFIAFGLAGQANGLPIDMNAMPHCAIAHCGSSSSTLTNDFFAGSNQNE